MESSEFWRDAIIGATLIEVGVRIGWALLGSGFAVLGVWGLRKRIKVLENKPPVIVNNVNNVYHGTEPLPPIVGDITKILTMTQAEYDALPAPEDKTVYLIEEEKIQR